MDPEPDAEPDPAIPSVTFNSRRQQKMISKKFFCLLPFESTGTFTLFFKDKKS
jgi:hypothetical protein